jgi:putative ABC transport system substrate-binding protein
VFAVGTDPIKTGIVASLNQPGGNVTGATFFANELAAKRLGLLHEMLPRATVIAVLLNPNFPDAPDQLRNVQDAARTLGLQILVLNASTESEIEAGFVALVRQRAHALFVSADPSFRRGETGSSRWPHIMACRRSMIIAERPAV